MHIIVCTKNIHSGSNGSEEGGWLELSLSNYGKQIFSFFKPIVHFYIKVTARDSNWNFVARNCAILLRGIVLLLRTVIVIEFLRNCAQQNCFASKNICSEEKNQTKGFARYTKFCDWSIIGQSKQHCYRRPGILPLNVYLNAIINLCLLRISVDIISSKHLSKVSQQNFLKFCL